MTSVVNLQAGGNVGITANNPLLKELVVGFGWDTISSNGPLPELVPSAILTDKSGKALSAEHFVFFNQLATPDDSVRYVTGDDKEQIEVNLSLVPEVVEKIVFIVYVDPDLRKPGNFASARGAYIRVADREEHDIARFDLTNYDVEVTAMIFGELYRYKGLWKFRAVGQGYKNGLSEVAKSVGLSI